MRSLKRQRGGFAGTIKVDGVPDLPCRIKDLSARGACLVGVDPSELPRQLTLQFRDRHGKVERKCRVTWTDKEHIGVEFVF